MAQIQLDKLCKSFGAVDVIKGIDLDIRAGEFMVFVGPSGCGKSTLLRLIAGLEEISSGSLKFDQLDVSNLTPSERKIAMVFQSYALYPHMSVYDNMAFGLKLAKADKAEVRQRVLDAAKTLEIDQLLDRKPKQLSGGQRQRVAIGRAIVRDPRVFLFDEPLSNLDAGLRAATRLEIAELHRRMPDTTMIYVTHDQVEAMTLADRICVLRDGVVEQVGTPAELFNGPINTFVASFIGSPKMNFLDGKFVQNLPCSQFGIRAEHIDICPAEEGQWSGNVTHTENLGSDQYLFVDIGAPELLVVRTNEDTKIEIGAQIGLSPQSNRGHMFDAIGLAI